MYNITLQKKSNGLHSEIYWQINFDQLTSAKKLNFKNCLSDENFFWRFSNLKLQINLTQCTKLFLYITVTASNRETPKLRIITLAVSLLIKEHAVKRMIGF